MTLSFLLLLTGEVLLTNLNHSLCINYWKTQILLLLLDEDLCKKKVSMPGKNKLYTMNT